MPITHTYSLLAKKEVYKKYVAAMKQWVASVKGLDVDPEYVTPKIFTSAYEEDPGEHIEIYVQELFEESLAGNKRTNKLRKKLLKSIKDGFKKFCAENKLTVQPRTVTVVIRRVDGSQGEYDNFDV